MRGIYSDIFCYVFQYLLHEDLHKFIFAFIALKSVPLVINLFLLLEEKRLRNHHVSQFGLSLKKLRAKSDAQLSPGQGLLMTQFTSFYAPIIPYPLTKLTEIHYGNRLNYLHFVQFLLFLDMQLNIYKSLSCNFSLVF